MVKKKPLRKCVSCNEKKEKRELLRIVKTKENEVFVDASGKKNGRGFYICKEEKCFNDLIKNKRYSHLTNNIIKEIKENL